MCACLSRGGPGPGAELLRTTTLAALHRQLPAGDAGFADTVDALVGLDFDQQLVPMANPGGIDLDVADLHFPTRSV